ncbi:carbohydrate ABC transporter permease [Gracilinema caldarium]|uniref:ABC-type transporter, integral membrane subunit n=1 Tax=Gracilinema caldarium (strain ATCC 51460 / DSM 7334 / H1) TaxID=744872 RepID=F8F422_GRAC1|nr:sugar ABC transporter permease [Gracilinema caldarium]AEJ20041.1 ABC-type transporter, integral membrane subunit [Gracilinema caldarium DSM 7334]
MSQSSRRNIRNGLIFVSPWILGFIVFQIYPIVYSLWLSFTRYSGFGKPIIIGFQNFHHLFKDPLFWKSAYNTLYYTILAVPIGVVVAIVLALAMNQKIKEVAIYRAILYIPSILPIFALSFVWVVFSNPRFGLLNLIGQKIGLPIIDWIGDARWNKLSLVLLAQLGAGGPALIFLAGIRAIPSELFDSAQIDGANVFQRFFNITLPLITPIILYDIILGLSHGLQIFTQAYIITGGGSSGSNTAGPDNSLLFYVFYVYKSAFQYTQMGYASALVWIFFIISMGIALMVFRWAKAWVNYDVE